MNVSEWELAKQISLKHWYNHTLILAYLILTVSGEAFVDLKKGTSSKIMRVTDSTGPLVQLPKWDCGDPGLRISQEMLGLRLTLPQHQSCALIRTRLWPSGTCHLKSDWEHQMRGDLLDLIKCFVVVRRMDVIGFWWQKICFVLEKVDIWLLKSSQELGSVKRNAHLINCLSSAGRSLHPKIGF